MIELDAHAPSYYAATAGAGPAAPPLREHIQADVCVVGGGFTGLGTALHLARKGMSVIILEQGPLGWGASGRNGGQAHVGMRRDQSWLERQVGVDDARNLWSIAIDARRHLDWLMHDQGVACDWQAGYLHADHKARYVPHTRSEVDLLRDRYGHSSVRFVDRDEIRHLVAHTGYHGGSLDTGGGHLHPLKLALGIAGLADKAGARLHAQSRATRLVRESAGWRVETPDGSVAASQIVLAGNGYLEGLAPDVATRIMPINNFIAVTKPLGPERAAALICDGLAVSDSRFVVYYYRMTPDHRLLFGGGENYSYRFPTDIAGFVQRHMVRIFPQLAKCGIDYAWGGTLAITSNRVPFVREVRPGVFNASGYSGLGVLLAPYFGKLLAEAIAGDRTDFDRLARLPVPPFPGGALLRWPTLVAAMSLLALRDRL